MNTLPVKTVLSKSGKLTLTLWNLCWYDSARSEIEAHGATRQYQHLFAGGRIAMVDNVAEPTNGTISLWGNVINCLTESLLDDEAPDG